MSLWRRVAGDPGVCKVTGSPGAPPTERSCERILSVSLNLEPYLTTSAAFLKMEGRSACRRDALSIWPVVKHRIYWLLTHYSADIILRSIVHASKLGGNLSLTSRAFLTASIPWLMADAVAMLATFKVRLCSESKTSKRINKWLQLRLSERKETSEAAAMKLKRSQIRKSSRRPADCRLNSWRMLHG